MAETLTELVAKISADATGLNRGLSDSTKSVDSWAKNHERQFKAVGIAMLGLGTAITGYLALSVKAFATEEAGVQKLRVALKNAGISYDDLKDSIEKNISVTQRKTAVADDEQREALGSLVTMTGNLTKAQDLLSLALDVSAGTGRDLTATTQTLGYALAGNWGMVNRMIPALADVQTEEEKWQFLRNTFMGQAATYGQTLAGQSKLLTLTIGDLNEAVGGLVANALQPFISRAGILIEAIKTWIDLNPKLAQETVYATAKLGAFSLALGGILLILPKVISLAVTLTGALGPWGLAIAAVSLAVGYLVADLLGLTDAMATIKGAIADVQTEMFKLEVEQALSANQWAKIKEQGYLTEQQFILLARAMKMTTAELHDQMTQAGMLEITMTKLGDTNTYLADSTAASTNAIETHTEATDKNRLTILEQIGTLEEQKTAYESSLESVNNAIEALKYERSEAGRLRLSVDDVIKSLYLMGESNDDITKTLVALGDEQSNVLSVLDAFGLKAAEVAKILGIQAEGVERLTTAFNGLSGITGATVGGLSVSDLVTEEEAARRYGVGTVGSGLRELLKETTAEDFGAGLAGWHEVLSPEAWAKIQAHLRSMVGTGGYANGGIVPGPIGQPQLATVHGGETIIPPNETIGGVTIQFTQPVFFEREDQMNSFVDKIAKAIDRKYRLRFGGAYSG